MPEFSLYKFQEEKFFEELRLEFYEKINKLNNEYSSIVELVPGCSVNSRFSISIFLRHPNDEKIVEFLCEDFNLDYITKSPNLGLTKIDGPYKEMIEIIDKKISDPRLPELFIELSKLKDSKNEESQNEIEREQPKSPRYK